MRDLSGVGGGSSCLGRTGRGDNGGLNPGLAATVADLGGRSGRDGVGGGAGSSCAVFACGDSTVIVGRGDIENALLSVLGVVIGIGCGDRGGTNPCGRSGSNRGGFAFGFGGGCGDNVLEGRLSATSQRCTM